MNFTCPQCQRRYAIDDEKVRGKTVRVRCKACQHVITLKGPVAEPPPDEGATRAFSLADMERLRAAERALAAPSRQPAPAAPPAPAPVPAAGAPVWFALLQGQQVGPLTEAELGAQVQAGALSEQSYFWREGLADWKRGDELPELGRLFFPAPARARVPARAPVSARPEALGALFDAPEPAPWDAPSPASGPGRTAAAPGRVSASGESLELFRHVAGARRSSTLLRVLAWVALPVLVVVALFTFGVIPTRLRSVDASGMVQELSIFTPDGFTRWVDDVLGKSPDAAAPARVVPRRPKGAPAPGSEKEAAPVAPSGGRGRAAPPGDGSKT
ncbi:MAG: zinc-ribbon domain-containing protein [Myxococcaceae bacterium]|nr:zinc-ribbon domain-containing protein [Myxococcaceae bacterium]MCI0670041.1 zinc-ribbon domain-containing protein [Myxococcaceae bacterium]